MLKWMGSVQQKKQRGYNLRRAVEVLNCTPRDYRHSKQWAAFAASAESSMKCTLEATRADDLCDAMFDARIDAEALAEKNYAAEQHTKHLDIIWDLDKKLKGDLAGIASRRKILEDKLARVNAKLSKYDPAE